MATSASGSVLYKDDEERFDLGGKSIPCLGAQSMLWLAMRSVARCAVRFGSTKAAAEESQERRTVCVSGC